VFEFQTTRRALNSKLDIGTQISLTHARYGWQNLGAGTVSPDDPNAFDARLAIVMGIAVDMSKEPFPVTLTVWRWMPGYHPTADLN
jgi:hypothetical protein